MGTYANIYIEYYNKIEDKWEFINPTYLSKTINSCWRQGTIRDLLDDRGWYNTPTKFGYPKNMSKELTEIFDKNEKEGNHSYNKGYITLEYFENHIIKKISENEEYIKNNSKNADIQTCNLKIDLLTKYVLTKDKSLVESIKNINSLSSEDDYESIIEYQEEVECLSGALDFCKGIGFLVGFLLDDPFVESCNIRLIYYFD